MINIKTLENNKKGVGKQDLSCLLIKLLLILWIAKGELKGVSVSDVIPVIVVLEI